MSTTSAPTPERSVSERHPAGTSADAHPDRAISRRLTARGGQARPEAGRRPALDGIRALAVLSVAIYHFGGGALSWLPGGFLGVDIFFVLSGYLITGLLLAEYRRTRRIDLRTFWVRRARRLVPALVVVLLAVIAWVWQMAPPESYPSRRSDLLWTVGYLANWHLIGSADNYFAAYTTASPLRHAWSLAVEEQFYLVWPLLVACLLWLSHRLLSRSAPGPVDAAGGSGAGKGRAATLVPLAVFAAVAAVASAWLMGTAYSVLSPSKAYYSTQGRVQELFAGVLLAVAFAHLRGAGTPAWWPRALGARSLTWISVIAAALLVLALCTMSDTAAFYYRGGALGVSLVAAALIGAVELRPGGPLARGFSWRPAVGLGRISYGVYLWHWPLTVAIPVLSGFTSQMKFWHQTERVVLTLLFATLSFWLIERPIQRDRRWLRNRVRVLGAVVTSMAVVLGTGVAATALPGTMSQQLSVTSDRSCLGEAVDHLISCVAPTGADATARPPAFVLLGDSTARALGHGFDSWAQATGNTWVQAAWKRCTATGLLVVPSSILGPDLPGTTCTAQAPGQIRQALSTYRPKTVIVAEFWPSSQPIWIGGQHLMPGTPEHAAALRVAYQDLVDEIASYGGHAVFVAMAPPGKSIGLDVARGRPAATARNTVVGAGKFVDSYNQVLQDVVVSRPDDASLVSLTDVICPGGQCPGTQGNTIIRVDGLHYSNEFAQELAPILLQRAGVG